MKITLSHFLLAMSLPIVSAATAAGMASKATKRTVSFTSNPSRDYEDIEIKSKFFFVHVFDT